MKKLLGRWAAAGLLLPALGLLLHACVTSPSITPPKPLPPSVKRITAFKITGGTARMQDTGVRLEKGDTYTLLAGGKMNYCPRGNCKWTKVTPDYGWPIVARIGDNSFFVPVAFGDVTPTMTAPYGGNLFLGYREGPIDGLGEPINKRWYEDDTGAFYFDIIVWNTDDFITIAGALEEFSRENPKNELLKKAYERADRYRKILVAQKEAVNAIAETQREIAEITVKKPAAATKPAPPPVEREKPAAPPVRVKKPAPSPIETATPPAPPAPAKGSSPSPAPVSPPQTAPPASSEKESRVAALEEKLAKLTAMLGQLDEMKKALEEERKKSAQLSEQIDAFEQREEDLKAQLEDSARKPPVLAIAEPADRLQTESPQVVLSGVAEDDTGIERFEVEHNGRILQSGGQRGIQVKTSGPRKRIDFRAPIRLEPGVNRITVRAVDGDGLTAIKTVEVEKFEARRNVWAVVVGIDGYQKAHPLAYAVSDARAFYRLLVDQNRIPPENVILLLDKDASLLRIRSALGTVLKSKAGEEDMVIIYFAGHGATEKDSLSADGDGLEKYLLPAEADPQDLYATALPMREIAHIFRRLKAERLVFIVDACYSGASGGRTISLSGIRAQISDGFLDRLSSGKGRVILTASGANEVSAENPGFGHGVFTYYLLEGMKGKADSDGDGCITVDEIYNYVSREVPRATGQEQHPVKKGAVEGRLVLGIVP